MTYLTRRLIRHQLGPDSTVYVNTFSGALDVFTDDEVRTIESIERAEATANPALLQRLRRRGYLFESREDEQRAFARLRESMRAAEQAEPTIFAVCPTYFCFFKCGYCYEGELTTPPHHSDVGADAILAGMSSLEEYLRRNLSLRDRPHITFLGGEPLQRATSGVVTELLEKGAVAGYRFVIITNGYLLDEFLPFFGRLRRALKYVQVTIDGPPEVHDRRRPLRGGEGTFARIAHNVDLALEAQLPVQLRTNVDAANIDALPALGRLIEERGWSGKRNFKAYLAPTEDSTCRGLRDVLPEDALLDRWFRLNGAFGKDLAVFDPAKLFAVTAAVEAGIRGGPAALPRFSYCAATKGKSFVFGPEGLIYQCLRGVGDARVSVGRYSPAFAVDDERVRRWVTRDVTTVRCGDGEATATLHGGGCALESLHRENNLNACSCGDARSIVKKYLEIRKDAILERSAPAAAVEEGG